MLGPQDPLPSRERLRSASVGGRLSYSSARKRGVGFTVFESSRELGGLPVQYLGPVTHSRGF